MLRIHAHVTNVRSSASRRVMDCAQPAGALEWGREAEIIPPSVLRTPRSRHFSFCIVGGMGYFNGMKITDVLRAEHAVFHNLFDHIETTVPRLKTLAEVKALAAVVEKVHEPHAKTEDDLFMEPLEHCFDQIGQNETFHAEHRQIEEALARARHAKTVKDAKRVLLGAIAACREHFDKEERIVFPLAERVLKAKTLSELGQAWLSRREG